MQSLGRRLYARSGVGWQNRLLSLQGWLLRRRRFGAAYRDLRAQFAAAEAGGRAAVLDLQARLLGTVITGAAAQVPYYREIFRRERIDPNRIRTPEDLAALPVLTKHTVRERREDLISEAASRRRLLHGHTSGTTGTSLTVCWDVAVDIATNAVLWRHREWADVPFGTRYATLLGQVIVPLERQRPPFWRTNGPWNQAFFSSFHLREENLDAYVEEMRRSRVRALEAYPSTAYVLARHLQARGAVLPLDAVFTTSEPLLKIQREVIEERFACRVFDYFGAAERTIFAGECPEHRGLHTFDEYGVTEIVDERGRPVPPGEPGRMVVTGLHNRAMPLIRYDIGDVSAFSPEPCPCGRPYPLLQPITTKAEDLVVLPDGRFISPSVLTHPFKPMTQIAESQIIQESVDLIRVLVVPRSQYTDHDGRRLMAALRERLGEGVEIRLERTDAIPRGARGKFRWVISKVPLRFGGEERRNLYSDPPAGTSA